AALAAAPIALARGGEPDGGGAGEPREGAAAPSPWRFFHRDATLTWAIILVGAFEFGMLGMTPVWGDRLGLGPGVVEGVLIAFAAGGLAAQPLIGWAADRLPARPCLAALAALCLASAAAAGPASDAAAAGAAGGETALYALFLLWGGAAIGLYTVALTELGARHAGATLAAGAAAFAIAYGLGALAAPPLIGALMDGAGPIGLPACLIGLTLVYLALLAAPRRAARA
ncbi:MAG: MFS transporter, partial [Pseudomonadota bacterium]